MDDSETSYFLLVNSLKRLKSVAWHVFKNGNNKMQILAFALNSTFFAIQVSPVISGRYVPSFWTANLEFADKKSIFDQKNCIFDLF